jgi:hypothetical protein
VALGGEVSVEPRRVAAPAGASRPSQPFGPGRGLANRANRQIVPTSAPLALLVGVALFACFWAATFAHPDHSGSANQPIAALLSRYDASAVKLDRVLSERDANPTLVESPNWVAANEQVVEELRAEYRAAQALDVPPRTAGIKACLTEGLRLTSTGAQMLHDAFLTGGHGAYYLSAHGNWDLNLGAEEIRQCRASLDELMGFAPEVHGVIQ